MLLSHLENYVFLMISSKLQAIGGFYLLPSIIETAFKIWVGWLTLRYSSILFLFRGS